jgi:hypothetical protein
MAAAQLQAADRSELGSQARHSQPPATHKKSRLADNYKAARLVGRA